MTTLFIDAKTVTKYLNAFEMGKAVEGDPSFRAALDDGKEFFLRDDQTPGFVLRLRASSRPAYLFMYRTKPTPQAPKIVPRKPVLGTPSPTYTAAKARKDAEAMQSAVREKRDPVAEKHGLVTVGEKTFASAIPAFLAARQFRHEEGALTLQNFKTERAYFGADEKYAGRAPAYFDVLHSKPLSMIMSADVAGVLDTMIRVNGRASATKARRCLSQFFNFCAKRGYMPEDKRNPVSLSDRPMKGYKARKGALLTGMELAAIWHASGDGNFGCVVKLLMLTGKRRNEIANLRRSEVHLDGDDNSWLDLPGSRTKSGNRDVVPLSPLAVAILRPLMEQREGSKRDYVFGVTGKGYANFSVPKRQLDELVRKELPDLQRWTLHHLRHTMRSTLSNAKLFNKVELNIDRDVLEVMLGHTLRDLDGVYNGHQYEGERRDILNAWADYIGRHAYPTPVVQFRRA